MMRQAERQSAEDAVQEDASLRQETAAEAAKAQGRLDAIKRDQEVFGAFYQHLLGPVEAHHKGATEVLLIPHRELFYVPWAALVAGYRRILPRRHADEQLGELGS